MIREVEQLLDAVPWNKMKVLPNGYIRTESGRCPIVAALGGTNGTAVRVATDAGLTYAAACSVVDAADGASRNSAGEIRAEMLRRIEAAKNANSDNQNGDQS